ncbi:MAG: DUF4215 domain-containing protein [Candidatus Peribacteraceae bacterium]|nr:DUF4215 domain-containing protein [Candidatus Peribacteraceae bacterium]
MHNRNALAVALLGCSVLALAAVRAGSWTASVDCALEPFAPECLSGLSQESSSNPRVLCGNSRIDPGEQCDDGRMNGATTCSLTCTFFSCGDGTVSLHLGEQCEPESAIVTVTDPVTGETVEEKIFDAPACGVYCTVPVCAPGGSCIGGCKRRYLSACASSASSARAEYVLPPAALTPASSSSAAAVAVSSSAAPAPVILQVPVPETVHNAALPACGNGTTENREECDDGNRNSDTRPDACRTSCTLPRCGDGTRDRGEQCDDGNGVNDDACTNDCRLPRCGDGIPQEREECDDGNKVAHDDCTNDCRFPACGDGIIQKNEQCDDGNGDNGDGCSNACRLARCGDGILQEDEECDDGARNSDIRSDACRTECVLPLCGDGVRDKGEECDDGAGNANDRPGACRVSCRLPRCGDGIIDPGERCDDLNDGSGDGCSSRCQVERGFSCDGAPSECVEIPTTAASSSFAPSVLCGNGTLEQGEQCDDGARNSDTHTDACRTDCRLPRCGDGVKDGEEECDGGETCTQTCKLVSSLVLSLEDGQEDMRGTAVVALTALEAVLVVLFLFRKTLARLIGIKEPRQKKPSLDDIPLSEIEMPGK